MIKELRKTLSEVSGIQESNIVLADVFSNRVYKFIPDSSSISSISESDNTCAYEILGLNSDCHENYSYSDPEKETPFVSVKLCTTEKNGINVLSSI